VPDAKNYTKDEFLLYLSPWSRFYDKTLQMGVDYLDIAYVYPATFPAGTKISWRWPTGALPKGAGVWGYHHIAFGDYSGGVVESPIESRQIKDIQSLTGAFDYSFEGSTNFNLLTETFLTTAKGDQETRTVEIGFFLHASAVSDTWLRDGKSIGIFTDSDNRSWAVARQGDFVTFQSAEDGAILKGTVDFKAAFGFLAEKGVITGEEWFNGLALGIEPTLGGGSGSATIHALDIAYN